MTGVRSSCAMSAVTRRSASSRCCSVSAIASTARASSSVSSRTAPPIASRTRTSVSPSATLRAAAAALRSRRESWPPISTPSALPPSDHRDRADDQRLVEVVHDVRTAVGEPAVQRQHVPVLERYGRPDVRRPVRPVGRT